ncbi:MAG TPA: tRNA preQ1(34) S-adenosylmethionine ribosyltransferase-isomerase QueA [bacterium (Candidatus Stahlbacteria)]|nr:tRNA preQ1(34) S-adenosylmethionine ribosyltransferase-isomerase QueA [Candidatus Stahlbacteria bacterium]
MLVSEFDYKLPRELIAQYPRVKREESKLLILYRKNGKIEHKRFFNIIEYMGRGDVLVLNETKVIPARLFGYREKTGGKVEVFLLKEIDKDKWEVLIKPRRKARLGEKIKFGDDFSCEVVERGICSFNYKGDFNNLLNKYGKVPLPPYIKREPEESDKDRYQTVYAKVEGAVAAPTAGLHFSTELLKNLKEKGINIAKILLHTGVASFSPIKCDKVEDHQMAEEYYKISEESTSLINQAKRVFAVGTTVVRTLESNAKQGMGNRKWELVAGEGWTNMFIYPPYEFKIVDALITNFHLPKSTNLILVAAFAGRALVLKAYNEAIRLGYRFYSYGDAMLIL